MWRCSSHTKGKFPDSNPDLRLDVPILPQGLPAVFLVRRLCGGLEGLAPFTYISPNAILILYFLSNNSGLFFSLTFCILSREIPKTYNCYLFRG